jgi:hypothetical protein
VWDKIAYAGAIPPNSSSWKVVVFINRMSNLMERDHLLDDQ